MHEAQIACNIIYEYGRDNIRFIYLFIIIIFFSSHTNLTLNSNITIIRYYNAVRWPARYIVNSECLTLPCDSVIFILYKTIRANVRNYLSLNRFMLSTVGSSRNNIISETRLRCWFTKPFWKKNAPKHLQVYY